MVTNPNAFLNKVKKPTTPDYTKVVGFGDAGSAIIKGTPLDSGISNLGKAPAPEKQIFNQKFDNQGGFNPVDVPQTPRATPTVPTAKNPVVEEVPAKPNTSNVDYTAVDNLDTQGLYRFIDNIQVRASSGEQISSQDQLLMREAQRKIQQSLSPAATTNNYETQITEQQKQKEAEAIRLKAIEDTNISAEEKRLNALYAQRTEQAQDVGRRTSQAAAKSTSFSGFGRSTFNADQQVQIQDAVNQNLSMLDAEKTLATERYRAEQAGATAEQLGAYDDRINQLRDKSTQFQLQQAEQINAFNQQNAAGYEEKINNLLQYASKWTDPKAPLTEQELVTAKAYGQIAIDKDGNVNTALLKEIDPKIMGEVIRSAAEARGAIPTNDFGFINVGGGLVAITDPTTGEVRYEQGQVPKEYSLEKIGDAGYVFDPTTGKAKPVSGGTSVTGGQADLYKQLRSGVDNTGKKFFGVYATGDPTGERFINGYYKPAESVGLDNYMAQWNSKGSTITTDMVQQAAQMYGVDPIAVAATMAFDSSMGTKGKGARNNNPGNIGQFDSLDAKGITVAGYPTLQDGVNAVAENLKKRLDASGLTPPTPKGSTKNVQDITLPEKATEFKAKSLTFAQRMQEADQKMKDLGLEDTFTNRTLLGQWYQDKAPEIAKSQEQKSLEIFKESFISGILRQESGAAISPTEFVKYEKQYFPMPGDDAATIKSKQLLRQQAIRNMYQQVGVDAEGTPIVSIYDTAKAQTPVDTTTSTGGLDDLRNNL